MNLFSIDKRQIEFFINTFWKDYWRKSVVKDKKHGNQSHGFLYHDNALSIREFLASKNNLSVPHPPLSPELTPYV